MDHKEENAVGKAFRRETIYNQHRRSWWRWLDENMLGGKTPSTAANGTAMDRTEDVVGTRRCTLQT